MRRFVPILALAALTSCTTAEVDRWLSWWEDDPQAAEDYANQEWVQRSLEWGCDSYCDVDDPYLQAGNSDVQADDSEATDSASVDGPDYEGNQDTAGIYEPWISLAQCESGGDWGIASGNGYYGGLQFSLSSWHAAGGSGYPHEHSASEQIARAEVLQDMQGWSAWPTCSRVVGLL
jgi:hypothetical protein